MATEIVVPNQKPDEVKEKVDEGGNAVSLESVPPSKENSLVDEEQKPQTAESSSAEVPVTQVEEKLEEKQIDPSTVIVAEKGEDDTHGLNVPLVDVPKETEALNLKSDVLSISSSLIEVAEKEIETQSTLSETLKSTIEAREELIERLEASPTQESETAEGKTLEISESETKMIEKSEPTEKEPEVVGKEPQISESESVTVEKSKSAPEEQLQVGKEADKGTKTDLEVEEKPQKLTEVLEDVKNKTGLEVEGKPQEQIGIPEEVEKKPALEMEDKTKEQTDVLEGEVEKLLTLEVGGEPHEQTEVLEEEVEKKLNLEVDGTLQGQTEVLEGEVEKQLTSGVKVSMTPQEQPEVLEREVEKLISEVNQTPQEQTGVLEGEVENKLASEVELTLKEQTEVTEGEVKKAASVVEGEPQEQTEVHGKEAEKKLDVEMEVKPVLMGVLEEVEGNPGRPKSEESTDVDVVTAKGEGTSVDKIEDVSESLKEEETTNLEEHVVHRKEEAPSDAKDVVPAIVIDDEENGRENVTHKEQSRDDVIEGLAKEAVVEVGKVELEKHVADENVSEVEAQNSVDVNDFSSAAEVVKESLEGGKASKDVGVADEEKREDDNKGDSETTKERDLEGKHDLIDTVQEPIEVPKELEPKNLEEPVEDKLNREAELVEQTTKSDSSNLESSKDVINLKTDGGETKLEATTKSAQKQSNNLISRVKHSIVKVKKAIIGKSPSSKTLSTDTKGDINVK